MPFRDRFRRLRKSSVKGSVSAENSPPSAETPEGGASTGEQTPAMTKTPTHQSHTDLTTIGEVLTHQATLKAETDGKPKKKGFFRRKHDPYKDWPEDVYKADLKPQPNEVPQPKYKRTPDPKHIENLSSFSFGAKAGDFMRRLSMQSGVSPGGSRRGSVAPSRLQSTNPSRNTSVADDEGKEDSGIGGSPASKDDPVAPAPANRTKLAHQDPPIGQIQEGDENETVSRQVTAQQIKEDVAPDDATAAKVQSRGSNDMPFTPHELTQALNKASLDGS